MEMSMSKTDQFWAFNHLIHYSQLSLWVCLIDNYLGAIWQKKRRKKIQPGVIKIIKIEPPFPHYIHLRCSHDKKGN